MLASFTVADCPATESVGSVFWAKAAGRMTVKAISNNSKRFILLFSTGSLVVFIVFGGRRHYLSGKFQILAENEDAHLSDRQVVQWI